MTYHQVCLSGGSILATRQPMNKTYTFQHRQHLTASTHELFAFFSDVRQLQSSTPTFFSVELRKGDLGCPLVVGQRFEYRFRLFWVPFPWTTEITEVGERYFTDTQRRGPYKAFSHQHLFYPTDQGTVMIDRIDYKLRFGPLNDLANRHVVRPLLVAIFRFRAGRAAENFGELDLRDC